MSYLIQVKNLYNFSHDAMEDPMLNGASGLLITSGPRLRGYKSPSGISEMIERTWNRQFLLQDVTIPIV